MLPALEIWSLIIMVVKNGKVKGIVTERDYLKKVVHKGKRSRQTKVEDICTMSPNMLVVEPDTDINSRKPAAPSRSSRCPAPT